MNANQRGNTELVLQCKSCYEEEEKDRMNESVPQRFHKVFKSQNHLIVLSVPFTHNGIFRSVHFQDRPKITLSFKQNGSPFRLRARALGV